MQVRIEYDPRAEYSEKALFKDSPFSTPNPVTFRIQLNNVSIEDTVFRSVGGFVIKNVPLNTKKKNIINFRIVEPEEKEELENAVASNIFRAIFFAFMALILPFAFMKFKSTKKPFTSIRFDYSPNHDFVLTLKPESYSYRFEEIKAPQAARIFGTADNVGSEAEPEGDLNV